MRAVTILIILAISFFAFSELNLPAEREPGVRQEITGIISDEYIEDTSNGAFTLKDNRGNFYSCKENLKEISDMFNEDFWYGDYVIVDCEVLPYEIHPKEINIISILKEK